MASPNGRQPRGAPSHNWKDLDVVARIDRLGEGRERLWLSSLLGASADGASAGPLRSLGALLASAGQHLDMDDWRPRARASPQPRSAP
jgi:hypothetical protein